MDYKLINDYFSSYFRNKRIRNGYSVNYVAERMGIPRSTYYAYEKNDRTISQEHIKKLLDIYNDDGAELIGGLSNVFTKYTLDLWAYINGYEVMASFDKPNAEKENIHRKE